MNVHTLVRSFLTICLLAYIPVAAQESQTEEDRALEEQFIQSKIDNGESHASGAREDLGPVILGNPTTAAVAIRVGLYANSGGSGALGTEFNSLHHQSVRLSNTLEEVKIIDLSTGREIAYMYPGQIFEVKFDGTNYIVTAPDAVEYSVAGPVRFMPVNPDNLFRIESIRRTNILASGSVIPTYRGAIEISRGSATTAGRVNLVNVLEVEKYVRGVVANESIASFHVEALKAQAVAARGYAIANIGNYARRGYPFDIVDSSSSQVYRGVASEHSRTIAATDQTTGLVASYNGRIISALYSSSFGGYSDSNHWIFNSPSSQLPGSNVTPYLTGIYDGEGTAPELTDPAVRQLFWTRVLREDAYDMCGRVNNRFARWRVDIPAATLKERVIFGTRAVVIEGNMSGDITDVQVPLRMQGSNRVAIARVIFTTGVAEIRGWDLLRTVFGRTVVSTPAVCAGSSAITANFTLTNPTEITPYRNSVGAFTGVITQGGGWGHNVGMSQYGAHGRGNAGQSFLQILKAYYSGVDIGSYPITIGRQPGSGPPTLRQEFYAPNAQGILEIRNASLKGLNVHINGTYDIILRKAELSDGSETIDLSPYLTSGLNVIQYNVVGLTGSATVNVNVQ